MDGFLNYQGVTVIAATNNEQAIDKALLRPGRFDHKIFVGLPNQLDRIQIFKIHLYNVIYMYIYIYIYIYRNRLMFPLNLWKN